MVQARSAATAADNDAAVKAIEQRLKCTCGCNLDIYTCRTTDFTCTYSPALHREVLELRKEARDSDAIVAAFVTKYGEQVLMAPKPEGFNLAGYLLPGAAVLTAGACSPPCCAPQSAPRAPHGHWGCRRPPRALPMRTACRARGRRGLMAIEVVVALLLCAGALPVFERS
jgi:cytochrome c-type biogenesis protein CcmH/NrfF